MRKILIVDDDPSLARTLELYFRGRNYDASVVHTGQEALNEWRDVDPDLILLDVQLPDRDGPEVLEEAKKENLKGDVIMITAFHDTEATLKAIRLGALDYLYKPIDLDALDLLFEKTLVQKRQKERLARLSHVISEYYKPDQIVGRSTGTLGVLKAIAQVAQSRSSVLIEGETGTGKELVARVIHRESSPEEPFMAVNCAAVVGNLLESEFFGHERGAFTGALQRKIGKFEYAAAGTVFLDEIGELPLDLQAKLLRVLQEKEFQRTGGVKNIPLPARVISATNKNLEELVHTGRFREDLYFRLKVFVIRVPPLRERVEDIVPLTEHFINKLNHEMHKKVVRIPKEYFEILQQYSWPGNIRELQNVLRRGMILSTGELLEFDENWIKGSVKFSGDLKKSEDPDLFSKSLFDIEKEHIERILRTTGCNLGATCRVLGISRPTLRKKIHDYQIKTCP